MSFFQAIATAAVLIGSVFQVSAAHAQTAELFPSNPLHDRLLAQGFPITCSNSTGLVKFAAGVWTFKNESLEFESLRIRKELVIDDVVAETGISDGSRKIRIADYAIEIYFVEAKAGPYKGDLTEHLICQAKKYL